MPAAGAGGGWTISVSVITLVATAVVVHLGGAGHVRSHGEVAEGLGVILSIVTTTSGLAAAIDGQPPPPPGQESGRTCIPLGRTVAAGQRRVAPRPDRNTAPDSHHHDNRPVADRRSRPPRLDKDGWRRHDDNRPYPTQTSVPPHDSREREGETSDSRFVVVALTGLTVLLVLLTLIVVRLTMVVLIIGVAGRVMLAVAVLLRTRWRIG